MRNTTSTQWTSARLIHMSRSLATAYGAQLSVSPCKGSSDRWNRQQLLNLSAAKSFPLN